MDLDDQKRKVPRFQIRGVTGAITTPREADLLDLSLRGACVEHEGMLRPDAICFLDLPTPGGILSIRCRVAHSRVSRRDPEGALYCQTGVEFLDLTPEGRLAMEAFIRSYGAL